MDSFNKVISFVLGLVVVVVFLAIASGKIDLRQKISGLSQIKKTTNSFSLFEQNPTLTPTPSIVSTSKTTTASTTIYNQYNQTVPKKIPATGSPTLILPLLFSSLLGGVYLRKKN
jgi:hypothetical protein